MRFLMTFHLHIASSPGDLFNGRTFFSLPLPRGRFHGPLEAGVGGHPDAVVELWPLASWPDGSLRMVQGLIPRYAGQVVLELRPASKASVEAPATGSSFTFADHQLEWFPRAKMYRLGREGLTYFDPENFVQSFSTAGGESVPARVVEGARVTEFRRDWLRLSALMEAQEPDGSSGLHFRITWDLFAGVPGCVLSVMVIHDCPGVAEIAMKSIETVLGLPKGNGTPQQGVQQKRCGYELTESRSVETTNPLDLRVEGGRFPFRIANFESLEDDNQYPRHLNPPPDQVGPVFWINNGQQRLIMEMEDILFLRPKGVNLREGKAHIGIWPDWAGPVSWPQGRRRQIRLAIGAEDLAEAPDAARFEALTAALLDTQRARLDPKPYRETGFFDLPWLPSVRPDLRPRIEGWVSQVSTLKTEPEFFHFGDTPDSHYTRTYYPLGRVPRKIESHEAPPGLFTTSGRNAAAAGNMDARQPVYVNNEYDVVHVLASEYLRSGNRVLFRQLGWFARHTIEVDFLCFHDWEALHRAQGAHSVNHTTGGAYPSHFWTQGLAQYYLLTGDSDALEVIRALAEKTIWYFDHPRLGKLGGGINREMGWAVLTLVSAYEVTMEDRFVRYARKLIDGVIGDPLPVDLPVFSFGHTSLLLGCKAYLEAVEHEGDSASVRSWYLEVVRLAVQSAQGPPDDALSANEEGRPKLSYDYERLDKGAHQHPRSGVMDGYAALACLSYAWRLTGDRSFIEAGVRTVRVFFDETPGYFSSAVCFRNPLPEGKPFAMAYRSMMEFFQALEECDLLAEFEFR